MTTTCRLLALLGISMPIMALETELVLPKDSFHAGAALESQQVEDGAVRHDGLVVHPTLALRLFDVGVKFEGWTALEAENLPDETMTGEVTELRWRIDYLIDVADWLQVLPFYQVSTYPEHNPRYLTEPHWLGVDTWFLLPWQGWEIGGSIKGDLSKEHRWTAALGAREFFQDKTNGLDLALWQIVNYGDSDQHQFLTGIDDEGFTTLQVGGRLTVPTPLEMTWVFIQIETWWWLDSQEREQLDQSWEWVVSLGARFDFDI